MTSQTPANKNIYKADSCSNKNNNKEVRGNLVKKTYLKKVLLITLFMSLILLFCVFYLNLITANWEIKMPLQTFSNNVDTTLPAINENIEGKLRYLDYVYNSDGQLEQYEFFCFDSRIGQKISGGVSFTEPSYVLIKNKEHNNPKYIGNLESLKGVVFAQTNMQNFGFSFYSKSEAFCVYLWGNDDKPIKYKFQINSE